MTKYNEAGKGSGRRKEDASKVRDNWDLIWGKKKEQQTMNNHEDDEPQERSDEDTEQSDEEWTCECCGGPMYRQAHWSYGQCDDCGARQELEDDF